MHRRDQYLEKQASPGRKKRVGASAGGGGTIGENHRGGPPSSVRKYLTWNHRSTSRYCFVIPLTDSSHDVPADTSYGGNIHVTTDPNWENRNFETNYRQKEIELYHPEQRHKGLVIVA